MQQFIPYRYDKEALWDNLERSRSALGLSKTDVASSLQINPKQYAVAANNRPNMRLSNAFYYAVAVGLTLDEAVRGIEESRFFSFLRQYNLVFSALPADSLLRSYPYKGLIPTFISFLSQAPDNLLCAMIVNAVIMAKSDLMQFFYRVVGVNTDFNSMFESRAVADPVDLFGENGLRRELRRFASKQEFASYIGLTLGQLSRYINHIDNKGLQPAEKKIETVPLLDKVLDICNSLKVDIDHMLKPLFIFDDFIDLRLESAANDSDKMFFFRLSFDHFTNIFQALPVLYPIVNRYCGASDEKRNHILELSRQTVKSYGNSIFS